MKTFLLYAVTAIAEIVGCYLPWRWLKEGGSPWLFTAPTRQPMCCCCLLDCVTGDA
jgi:drug/metabolite transporter superfamily protein YnfA